MPLSDTDEELLIRYLDGALDPAEEASLQTRLRQEPELQAGYERLRLAARALHWGALNEQVAAARRQHEAIPAEATARKEAPVRPLRWLRPALAAAAVLAGLWIGIRWYDSTHLTPNQVYTRHFINYDLSAQRGSDTASPIEAAYAQEKYGQAYALGKEPNSRLSPQQRLLVGLSALHLNRASEAAALLQPLEGGPFAEDAAYYRALALIKLKRPLEALDLLLPIRNNPAHLYHGRVTEEMIRQVQTLD
ncbi:hypothetical protein [Flaviaesturariibacter amylovorans]|uniref:Tetratricopeptide repeat protein n=1 Tax=Flaviaesturariibacter amylovorans TaxID=1084520 RepID=A0ABP8G813_9BACT